MNQVEWIAFHQRVPNLVTLNRIELNDQIGRCIFSWHWPWAVFTCFLFLFFFLRHSIVTTIIIIIIIDDISNKEYFPAANLRKWFNMNNNDEQHHHQTEVCTVWLNQLWNWIQLSNNFVNVRVQMSTCPVTWLAAPPITRPHLFFFVLLFHIVLLTINALISFNQNSINQSHQRIIPFSSDIKQIMNSKVISKVSDPASR